MENFGALLKKYINEQGTSAYQLAKSAKIDRTFLQNIISGKKQMPESRLNDIVNLNTFTSAQMNELVRAFYFEKYDSEKLEVFDCIEKGMRGGYLEKLTALKKYESINIETGKVYKNSNNISALINEAVKNSARIYTDFSFTKHDEISAIIYKTLKENKISDFFHITTSNENRADKIKTVFYAQHFAEIGYYTYFTPDLFISDSVLPYFILTDSVLIQFDESGETALTLDAKLINDIYEKKIEEIKKTAETPVNIIENSTDLMKNIQSATVSSKHETTYSFDEELCATFITKEIIEEIATPQAKSLFNIAEQLTAHYKLMLGDFEKNSLKVIVDYNAIADFVCTGRILNFPKILSDAIPVKMRPSMLEPMIESDFFNFVITNPNYYESSHTLSYQINDNILILTSKSAFDDEMNFNGKASAMSRDKEICDDFRDFLKYFKHTEKCYNEEVSENVLRGFIEKIGAK